MGKHAKYAGAIPGYGGHVPCMRNHIVGRSYTNSTERAAQCDKAFRRDDYASVAPLTVDSRPQGRDFLYAQTAKTGYELLEKQAIHPRVSKRHPPGGMFHATGLMDVRSMRKCVGTTEGNVVPTVRSASLPVPPYRDPRLQLRKSYHTAPQLKPHIPTIPGYTGHQHASQHVFGKSYGNTRRGIITEECVPDKPTVKELLYYWDGRPQGRVLQDKYHKIPGYQGFIPSKNNHVFAKTSGKASELATVAEQSLKERRTAGGIYDLVDNPPQGRVDLYAQAQEQYFSEDPKPLYIRVDKRTGKPKVFEVRPDYKVKEILQEDAKEVMQAKHHVHGYTGHVHASQHIYARPYGKMTRELVDQAALPSTSGKYLDFTDCRALVDQSENVTVS